MLRRYRRHLAVVALVYVVGTHAVVAWDYVAPHVCFGVRRRAALEVDDACLL